MTIALDQLEEQARQVASSIGGSLPAGVGFTLLLYSFGEGGHLTYISNANRADMVKAMRELLAKWEPPQPPRRRVHRIVRQPGRR